MCSYGFSEETYFFLLSFQFKYFLYCSFIPRKIVFSLLPLRLLFSCLNLKQFYQRISLVLKILFIPFPSSFHCKRSTYKGKEFYFCFYSKLYFTLNCLIVFFYAMKNLSICLSIDSLPLLIFHYFITSKFFLQISRISKIVMLNNYQSA